MPLGTAYDNQACSVAGTLGVVGDRWTLLIVRDAMLGIRRFDEFQSDLGIARNVLQSRLERLVADGILDKHRYQERPERFEYRLTQKGLDLWPVVVSLMHWGDAHARPEAGPAVILEHRDCGGTIDAHRICTRCGERLGPQDSRPKPGPGATERHPLHRRAAAASPRGVDARRGGLATEAAGRDLP